MGSITDRIVSFAAILVAGLLAYLSLPVLQGLIAPSEPPLWEPIVSNGQAAVIVAGITGFITGIWLFLAVTNRFRNARDTDNPMIPDWFWVVMLVLMSLIPAVLGATIITYILKSTVDFLLIT